MGQLEICSSSFFIVNPTTKDVFDKKKKQKLVHCFLCYDFWRLLNVPTQLARSFELPSIVKT
jgi:hypothetical protein